MSAFGGKADSDQPLDIDAETTNGFPEDVESIVRDNAASLRIMQFGFETE